MDETNGRNSGGAGIRPLRRLNRLARKVGGRLFGQESSREEYYDFQDADIYIISFPKSGRTWLRLMLGKYITELAGIAFDELMEVYHITKPLKKFPTIAFVHDGANGYVTDDPRELKKRKERYRNKKVVFLARDLRDTLVSYYFHLKRRVRIYDGEISSFIRDEYYGAPKAVAFLNVWAQSRRVPKDFLLMRYEDMRQNPAGELARLLEFMGIPLEDHLVKSAVEFASFDNMKSMEKVNKFASNRIGVKAAEDAESYKVRKGRVRGYHSYLSQDDVAFLTDVINTKLSPYFGYRYLWEEEDGSQNGFPQSHQTEG